MRMLFFIGQLGVGGAEQQLVNMAIGLKNAGHSVDVLTIYSGGQNAQKIHEISGINLKSLWVRKGGKSFIRVLQLSYTPLLLRRVVKNGTYDCVYSMLYFTNLIAWFATRGKYSKALIWGLRSSNMSLNLKREIPNRICSFLSTTVPLVIANSYAGKENHQKSGYRPDKFEVIYNGIDTELFKFNKKDRARIRCELNIAPNRKLIGMVARLDPMKDHPTFLKAAALVVQNHNDVQFLCVGGGTKAYIEELCALTEQLGLAKHVIWLGNRIDIAPIYSALELSISCSFGEGFSNVIGEAMSCGVPCVATDVGDSADIVGNKAFIVEPRKPKLLAQTISRALQEVDNCRFKEECRDRIKTAFSLEKLILNTERVLTKCCHSNLDET